VPILALSAESNEALVSELTSKGFDGFIEKPIKAGALVHILRAAGVVIGANKVTAPSAV
jgi:AmiR/NasT family two-component response regulator